MGYLSEKPPLSRRQIKNLGKAYRDGLDVDKEVENLFFDHQLLVMITLLEEVKNLLEKDELGAHSGVEIYSRVKTVHTTREKLQRMQGYSLDGIQDIVGIRITADISLSEQERVAEYLAKALLESEATKVTTSDTRVNTHSGYRAVHLRATFPAGRTEIQIRTTLQAKWANLFEAAGDNFGREIRYMHLGENPHEQDVHPKVFRYLELSDMARHIEERWNLWEQERTLLSESDGGVNSEFLQKMKHHTLQLLQQEYDDIKYHQYKGKDGE